MNGDRTLRESARTAAWAVDTTDMGGYTQRDAWEVADAVLAAVAAHPGLAEALARALYEEQRATIPAADPMIAIVGVPWGQAPTLIREQWTNTCRPLETAARAWIRGLS